MTPRDVCRKDNAQWTLCGQNRARYARREASSRSGNPRPRVTAPDIAAGLPAERYVPRREECPHVLFERRRDKARDALAQASQAALRGIESLHLLPVLLTNAQASSRLCNTIQEIAHEKRGVLRADLSVEAQIQRPPHQLRGAEVGEGAEISLLFLRGLRRLEARQEFAYSISPPA